jgi:3,4-dehydroadipyl-CoA semialdehyde dehydrogenase
MTELLSNFVAGRWQAGTGAGTPLFDPVLGTSSCARGRHRPGPARGLRLCTRQGGAALRALSYRQRAEMLARIGKVLQANRDAYYEISTANSGTVKNDTAVDVDGAIYTLGSTRSGGHAGRPRRFLLDGEAARSARSRCSRASTCRCPRAGLALFINAFNFPAWGLWEKAAPALLSGVPVVVKPATATAWLTQRMVKDVVDAGILPPGALRSSAAARPGCWTRCSPSTCCRSPAAPTPPPSSAATPPWPSARCA